MKGQESTADLLTRIERTAHDYEKEVHGCSRSVLKALQDHLDLGDSSTLKASTPLAAGVAMRGETCGALLGGLLAVGIETANDDLNDTEALFGSLASGYRLARKVEKELKSTTCSEIQKRKLGRFFSLVDPEQYAEFIEAGGYDECSKVVGKIAKIAGEHILELRSNPSSQKGQ